MSLRTAAKSMLLGRPGARPRRIRVGLLKGLQFTVDTACKSQRIVGLDEVEIAAPLRKLADECVSAVDIGANDGWYALYFASRPNIHRVVACEPDAEQLENFAANFGLNPPNLAAKVTRVDQFIGDREGAGWDKLDAIARGLPGPVLLKIDVDGGEMGVLRGGEELIRSGAARIVLETHSAELEEDCLEFLRSRGYTCEVVRNGWYRAVVPESRALPHNRWLVAVPARVKS